MEPVQIHQVQFQNLLIRKFNEARRKNPAYSIRAFAERLEVGSGPLSQILNGKRKVSEKMAFKIMKKLNLSPSAQKEAFRDLAEDAADDGYLLEADRFALIADWYHYGILSLLAVKGFQNHPRWIAQRLGISENQASDAISRLLRLKILSVASNGKLKRNYPKLTTTDGVPSDALKKAHSQGLELAGRSLWNSSVAIDRQDFTYLTVPTNPERIRLAKLFLRKARNQLCEILMDTTEKTEVYRLSVQLFPLTVSEGERS